MSTATVSNLTCLCCLVDTINEGYIETREQALQVAVELRLEIDSFVVDDWSNELDRRTWIESFIEMQQALDDLIDYWLIQDIELI